MTGSSAHQWSIRDVLDRVDLAELLDEHTAGVGSGARRRWHCPVPDHSDEHPSVTIHRDRQGHERWRCWSGTDHRGDAIDLVMMARRVDRATAINDLSVRAGLQQGSALPPVRERRPVAPAATSVHPDVLRYIEICERLLWTPVGRPVLDYLHGRGFNDEILRANHVGADPGRARLRRPRGLPYGSGLGATFPALDREGVPVYVQTRAPEPGRSKYENPSARLAPNPRLGWTQTTMCPRARTLLVCEGLPDALTAAQADFATVGLLGTAPFDDHVVAQQVAAVARAGWLRIAIVADCDDRSRTGVLAARRLLDRLTNYRIQVVITMPPPGKDLNAWAVAEPAWAHISELTAPSSTFSEPARSMTGELGR